MHKAYKHRQDSSDVGGQAARGANAQEQGWQLDCMVMQTGLYPKVVHHVDQSKHEHYEMYPLLARLFPQNASTAALEAVLG